MNKMSKYEHNLSFLDGIDMNKINELLDTTTTNVEIFDKICAEVVKKYSEPLDNLMKDLFDECIKAQDSSTNTLEKYFVELSTLLYFMGERLEKLGVYADMSKAATKEIYSKNYLDNRVKETTTGKNKRTIAELQALAELASQYESVVNSIYTRAYNIMRYKVSAAQDMSNTLKKIINGRQIELNASVYSNRTLRGDEE